MNAEWRNRYELAIQAAQQAGQWALRYFDADVKVEWKYNQTPVTIADREGELLIRKLVSEKFPEDGFLGEEFGETPGSSGFRWILDPIDGTRSFMRGIPMWATLIGLEHNSEQIAGVAYMPATRQMYRALRGDGAFRDDRRIQVSKISRWQDTQMFYSPLSWFMSGGCKDAFLELVNRTQRQRGFGDFYGFLLVAQGSGEFIIEYGVNAWDVAALKPIIEEAGGRFTDWDNHPTIHRPDVFASNGLLHDEPLAIVKAKLDKNFRPEAREHEDRVT